MDRHAGGHLHHRRQERLDLRGRGAVDIAQSYTGKRSASGYLKVLKLFNITKSPRYQAGSTTYCHIFVQDVTWASGALVSHAFDAKTGANATFAWGKNVWKDGIEHDANSVVDWFNGAGSKTYGWRKLASGADAQASADKGIPVVAAWKNPTAAGHVAMVIPSSARVTKTAGTITMAGAGVTNHFGDDISEVFKAAPLADVQFFEHK